MSGYPLQPESRDMYHFFVDKENIQGNTIYIEGKDVNHIKNVLRMHIGEELSVGNGEDEDEYVCEIVTLEEDRIECNLMFVKHANVESPAKIYLFQGLPKSDKMELIIQKCVELGVTEIIPVATKRCVVKIDEKKAGSKVARWQSIAEAAGKQSKRAIVPNIGQIMSFKEAVKYSEKMNVRMIPYELCEGMEETRKVFDGLKPGDEIAVFIGPEGGFDTKEIDLAKENGITPISLGQRILRTETAGMAVLAWISYVLEVK